MGNLDTRGLEEEIARLEARVAELESGEKAGQVLRSIAENTPSNIMLLNLDHCIEFINHTVPGITPEEMIGLNLTNVVEEEFREGIRGALERVAKTGEPDQYETQYTSPSGDISWWDSRVGPVKENGKVTSFVVVSTNVTEQRERSEEQERFFNLSVDMMCVAGLDGYFKHINRAFQVTLGYEGELLERPFAEFIHPDDLESTRASVEEMIAGHSVLDFRNRYLTSDGTYRRLSWRGAADLKRGVIYAVARDVTNTEHLEEQLQQARRIEAVGKLAGGIAHDFNNLLMAIQGNIDLAQETPGSAQVVLPHAMDACHKASALTKQLLAFSRHEPISPKAIDLGGLMDDIMVLLQRLLPESIEIILEHPGPVPLVLADRSQLEQVVVNLCVNARDAMPDGGTLRLRVEKVSAGQVPRSAEVPTGDYVMLAVNDTGCGMTPELREHIFEPFYTTKPMAQGTGLGLSTVYGIVQQNRGFLDVESEVGQGSTFRMYLPTTELSLGHPAIAPEPDRGAMAIGTETILIAEDEPMVQAVMVKMLQKGGYSVLTANDGQEAIELYRRHANEISLVVLDVIMPNLGGLDTASRLRELDPDLKVIFASGHVQTEHDHHRLLQEILLAKPFRSRELLHNIRTALDS